VTLIGGTTPLSTVGTRPGLATTQVLHLYCYSADRRATEFPSCRSASAGVRCRLARPGRPGEPGVCRCRKHYT